MSYGAFETLVAQARPTREPWRLAVAVPLIIVGFLALNLAYFGSIEQVVGPQGWRNLRQELSQGSTPRAVLLMLFSFATLAVAMGTVIFALHGRGLISLIGPLRPAFRDFVRVLSHLAVLNIVLWAMPWPAGIEPQPQTGLGAWLSWLPLALLAILVQTTAEELGFRGYLQAQLAAWVPSPIVWLAVPSVLFALLHYDVQTFGDNAWIVAAWAGVFAVMAADLTARAGNLGPALAWHLANNISAMLVLSMAGHWDGLALHVLPVDPADEIAFRAIVLIEGGVMLCSWLAARVAIRR